MKFSLDLKNKKFNRLTAICKTNIRKNGCIIWQCMCDCGNKKLVCPSHLTCGLDTKGKINGNNQCRNKY
jgi:hypothetical protein